MSVAFSPDGRFVAAGNNDGFVRIWDVQTSQLVAKCEIGCKFLRSLIFTPDGKGIVVGGKTLQGWDLSALREVHSGKHVMNDTSSLMNKKFEFNDHKVGSSFASSTFKDIDTTIVFLFKGEHHRCLHLFRPPMACFKLLWGVHFGFTKRCLGVYSDVGYHQKLGRRFQSCWRLCSQWRCKRSCQDLEV
jgi:WD40 repeat protein